MNGQPASETASLAPDLTVGDLLNHWGHVASVFVTRRMACVGCPLASFETLDNVARVYAIPLDRFMGELQQAISEAA